MARRTGQQAVFLPTTWLGRIAAGLLVVALGLLGVVVFTIFLGVSLALMLFAAARIWWIGRRAVRDDPSGVITADYRVEKTEPESRPELTR